jgi:enamine deaminase RidA (YjgF/YER057c/UK114 family)
MTQTIEARLSELGIELPPPAAPAANYIPYTLDGRYLYVSGQLPFGPKGLAHAGKLGADITIEKGQQAAGLCALNILSQANAALGSLDRIERCLKLGGFVNAAPDFTEHPAVINGASDMMVSILGDAGRHARFAVGCASLPMNAAVEVDAIFAVS